MALNQSGTPMLRLTSLATAMLPLTASVLCFSDIDSTHQGGHVPNIGVPHYIGVPHQVTYPRQGYAASSQREGLMGYKTSVITDEDPLRGVVVLI